MSDEDIIPRQRHEHVPPEGENRGAERPIRAKLSDEELRFARWQIKHLQRMIHEIRQWYGIQE